MAEKAGRKCPELIQPDVPLKVRYLWRWFVDMWGGERMSWNDMKAWAELTGRKPNEWEISTIRAIEREFLKNG